MAESSGGALRQIAASFGIEFDSKKLDEGVTSINGAVGVVRAFAGVIAGAELIKGISEFITSMTETGSALNDASDRLGVTTRDLQQLQFAAGQAGVRGEQLNAALTGLAASAEAAKAGTGHAGAAFHALGVRVTDMHGRARPASELMDDIAHGMDRITDPARRVTLASDIFGRAGRRLVGVLHGGAGGLAEMRQQLEDLGGGMSDEAVRAADDYGDSLERLKAAQLSVKSTIANLLLPTLTTITDWAAHGIAQFQRLTRGTHVWEVALGVLGAAAVGAAVATISAWAPVLLPFVLGAAAVAAMVLIVEDLWTAFNGGDSAIGRVVDANTHLGTMRDLVGGIRLAWFEVSVAIQHSLEWVDDLIERVRAIPFMGEMMGPAQTTAAQRARFRQDERANEASERLSLMNSMGSPVVQAQTRAQQLHAQLAPDLASNRTVRAPSTVVRVAGDRHHKDDEHTSGQTTHIHDEPHIHIHGGNATAPQIAERVRAMLDARAAARHDADHPREPAEQ